MKSRVCVLPVLGLLALVMIACSSTDDPVEPVNQPPTITFTFTKLGVPRGTPVDLTVDVSDPDEDDDLTVSWSITRGSLTPQNTANTVMEWQPPVTLGLDTVIVSVTDGEATRSVTEEIQVGTRAGSALQTFSKAQSPYILVATSTPPNISVPAGQTTTVEAGVEILVDVAETVLDVNGTLTCNGTESEPVVIRANDRTLACGGRRGWWDGIRAFTDQTVNGQINLTYTEVWYGEDGVRLRDAANARIVNSSILCSGNSGVLMGGSGQLALIDSEVSNGQSIGVSVSSLAIEPDTVLISGCDISFNTTGLLLDLRDTDMSATILIDGCNIEGNSTEGVLIDNSVFPVFRNNTFFFNGQSGARWNIRLRDGYPGGVSFPELDATMNYWGVATSNQATIDATIRDSLDSGAVGTRVKSSPWCNDPDCNTTGP